MTRIRSFFLLTIPLFLFAVFFLLILGASDISFTTVFDILKNAITHADSSIFSSTDYYVVTELRLPRMILAFLVGAVLAISGAILQTLFRNPLADPSLIGVSSGAALGAALALVYGSPVFWAVT